MRPDASIGNGASASRHQGGIVAWYRSRAAWRFVLARYVPLLAAGNLVWEIVQLPFYTLWHEGMPQSQVFAVVHCTIGDVMIGTAALLTSVMLFGRQGWPRFGHGRVLATATSAGIAYTVFSEWMNTQVTMSWQYAEAMLQVPPLGTGIAPLLQWLVVPPLAYLVALRLISNPGTGLRRGTAAAP